MAVALLKTSLKGILDIHYSGYTRHSFSCVLIPHGDLYKIPDIEREVTNR